VDHRFALFHELVVVDVEGNDLTGNLRRYGYGPAVREGIVGALEVAAGPPVIQPPRNEERDDDNSDRQDPRPSGPAAVFGRLFTRVGILVSPFWRRVGRRSPIAVAWRRAVFGTGRPIGRAALLVDLTRSGAGVRTAFLYSSLRSRGRVAREGGRLVVARRIIALVTDRLTG
jgi:hypothetical protein